MIVEQTHKSLIHGVSEQHPNQRLEGQLGEMWNMYPDAVTGLRRRRGFKVHSLFGYLDGDGNAVSHIPYENLWNTRVFYKEFSGAGYIVAHNCSQGELLVYNIHGELLGRVKDQYLVGEKQDFREATVSGFLGILNLKRVPEERPKQTYAAQRSTPAGFLYAFAGNTDWNYAVNMFDYDYIMTADTYGLRGVVLYITIETGSGTDTKPGKWFATAHSVNITQPRGSLTDEEVRRANSDLRRRIATGSYQLTGGTIHQGDIPAGGEWFGHKLSYAFNVTATGIIHAVEYVLHMAGREGWGLEFSQKYDIAVLGSALGLRAKQPGGMSGGLDIRTSASSKNLIASGSSEAGMQVGSKEQLPPRLPAILDGYVVGTGVDLESRVYWRYQASNSSWVEGVAGNQETELVGMPVMLSCETNAELLQRYVQSMTDPNMNVSSSGWDIKLDTGAFIGRTVGNTQNNATPEFVGRNFTGIAGYQGRLVLLCGSEVYMSRNNKYNEFYRSSVQQVVSSDPIAMQNLNLGGTEFRYAIEFNRDLVLISPTVQAVIPYSTALTPQNAVMHFSSRTSINAEVPPLRSGRELLYCTTNSQSCVQVGRFVPDSNSDSQFTPELMTLHIPTYYHFPVKSWDANSLSGMVVLSNGGYELLVQCNTYQGITLLQNAWHKWTAPYPVIGVWFVLDTLYCVVQRGSIFWTMVLPTTKGYENYPMVDFWRSLSRAQVKALHPDPREDKAVLVQVGDVNNGAPVQLFYRDGGRPYVESEWLDYEGSSIAIGKPYTSSFTLTPPVLRQDQAVYQAETASARWLATYLQVRDSGAFKYTVRTPNGETTYNITVSPQGYLGYGAPIGNLEAGLHVQAKLTEAQLEVHTKGLQDLNVIGATSAVKFGVRRRHWR